MTVSTQLTNNWVTSLSQRLSFRSRMAATAKKVKTLGSVVRSASQLYQKPSYKEVQEEVQINYGGFKNWVSFLKNVVATSTQTLLNANQERMSAESSLSRLGFIVGGSLEQETEHSNQRDVLIKNLISANLYRKSQSAQLNLLPKSAIDHTDTTQNLYPRGIEQTAKEVIRLTSSLDELLSSNPNLNHGDAQYAFFLRDSIYGLIRDYSRQKQNGAIISDEFKQYLIDNKDIFERAVAYSRWSDQLKSAIGI